MLTFLPVAPLSSQAYELSTLTGTQVLLLVASETGHVYTFATRKLQPMITSETGKALIQTCLNSPDSPPRSDPSMDQRMSATGFEETDLTYQVSESESMGDTKVRADSGGGHIEGTRRPFVSEVKCSYFCGNHNLMHLLRLILHVEVLVTH